MRKKIKGKKGFEVIGDLPTWLITALIILCFFFVFKLPGCLSGAGKESEMVVNMRADDIKINYELMNFLRQPVEVDGEKLIVSDLLDAKLEIVSGYWPAYRVYHKHKSTIDTEMNQEWLDKWMKSENPLTPSRPLKESDKVVFMGVDDTVKNHGERYQKYLKRADKFDEILKEYLKRKYMNTCWEFSAHKGNVVWRYLPRGDEGMNEFEVQRARYAANSFQSYDRQNIGAKLRLSGYLFDADPAHYCIK